MRFVLLIQRQVERSDVTEVEFPTVDEQVVAEVMWELPTAMVDVEGMGIPHVLGKSHRWGPAEFLLQPTGSGHQVSKEIAIPFSACGC